MKKLLALLLAVMMVMGLATTIAIAADENTDFVTLNWYTKGTKPTDYDMVMDVVNTYLKDKINANVNINFYNWGDEWDAFVNTQVATNEGDVDIMFCAVWDRLYTYVDAGYFIPLNGDPDYGNLLEEYGQAAIAAMDPSYISGNEINGVLYGMSCNKELAANHGLLFNADLVEKYGFDLSTITTLADIEPMLAIIKENEPDLLAPVGLNENGFGFFSPFVELAGDGYVVAQYDDDRSPQVVNEYATPEWKALFDIARDWYQKGYIYPDAVQRGTTYEADYQNGLYFCIPQSMKPGKGAEFSVNGKASLEVVLTKTVIRTKDVGGSMLCIVEGSKNPERAMQFISLLESDSYLLNTILFGLEGTHFNFVDTNRVQITEQGTNNYNMKGNAWMFGNQFLNYTTTEEAPDKWANFIAFNAAGVPVQSLGFSYDVSDVSSVLSAVTTVRAEYADLYVGALDVETKLPEYIAALEAAGVQQVIEDVQRQFDAWKAAQ